jgi:ArsR family transcriptional regulator, arsenate/arsenite/antimonite-responsive transcriptional repressor / arsenate reductase (thioredoxin)
LVEARTILRDNGLGYTSIVIGTNQIGVTMSASLATTQPPELLKMLSHELRWQLVSALAYSDRRVHELVDQVGRPMNLVSYHLRQLRQHELVTERRSAADARDVYYSLDLDKLRHLYLAAGEALHPALSEPDDASESNASSPTSPPTRVLFLCTHNSARSQIAEAIARKCGNGRIEAYSAGTEVSEVNPYAIRVMEGMGMDTTNARSKHMNEFLDQEFDYVITVCDRARESCPIFPGDPKQIHWSFSDPAAVEGTDAQKLKAFNETARQLTNRINHLLMLLDRKEHEAKRRQRS